jgi:hypothetical protein
MIVPFRRWHIAWLVGTGKPESGFMSLDTETLMVLEKQNSWTAVIDGSPVACGGTIQHWPGRHQGWMYLNKASGKHMRWLTAMVFNKLNSIEGRLEISVRCDFALGHKWAKMLGFRVETERMVRFGPEGEDHTGYVRITE